MSVPSTGSQFRSRQARTLAGAAITIAAAVALAGCTSSGSGGSTPTASGPKSGSPSHSSSASNVPATIPPTHAQVKIPGANQIVEVPALRKTIALTSCKAASGGWSGKGTAKNPTSTTQTYHLLVFFTDKYSRTIDYARTSVDVPAGKTQAWTATSKFSAPKGTQCVLRGLYSGAVQHNGSTPSHHDGKHKGKNKKNG